jgi:hypothetical protein
MMRPVDADLPRDPTWTTCRPSWRRTPAPSTSAFIDPESGAVYPLRRWTREELATIMAEQRRNREGPRTT